MKVLVVGGGAAGFFAALSVKEHHPDAEVVLLERSNKTLAKVKVSGGGRCNVTHRPYKISEFIQNYPRGSRFLKKVFSQFGPEETMEWFQKRGLMLHTEADGRMFPTTNRSQSVIDLLTQEAQRYEIKILLNTKLESLSVMDGRFIIHTNDQEVTADKVIIASGGSPKRQGLEWLEDLGHAIVDPVPSLFTFNLVNKEICELSGLSVERAMIRIQGSKVSAIGPLLITHWGMSGPAVLKCSAFGARILSNTAYEFHVQVNWLGDISENDLRSDSAWERIQSSQKRMVNQSFGDIPSRLWRFLLLRSGLGEDKRWCDVGSKQLNRLINTLTNDVYAVKGKSTFKEEFVTAGGVSLESVTPSLESRSIKGLYFAGEVLDIDGVTGGFNFQAAWSTAWVAGKLT